MVLRLLRYALAIHFLNIAPAKLLGAAVWVTTFDLLGGSQTGRYITGTLQLIGAILSPRVTEQKSHATTGKPERSRRARAGARRITISFELRTLSQQIPISSIVI
jgi:hypothetical protein